MTSEAARDRQVARENVRDRKDCQHCNPQPSPKQADPDPEVGSLYLDYDGNAWRLRSYNLDMMRTTDLGEDIYQPHFSINYMDGRSSTRTGWDEAAGLRLIWSPTGGPR